MKSKYLDTNTTVSKSIVNDTSRDKKIKVKNSDVYDIASITKIASTVPLLMQMVDQEKLNLNDKLGQYLDLDFSNKEFLKIRDVLAHQAGLLAWIPFYKQTDKESKNNNSFLPFKIRFGYK